MRCSQLGDCVDSCNEFLDFFSDFISKTNLVPKLVTFSADVSDCPALNMAPQLTAQLLVK